MIQVTVQMDCRAAHALDELHTWDLEHKNEYRKAKPKPRLASILPFNLFLNFLEAVASHGLGLSLTQSLTHSLTL